MSERSVGVALSPSLCYACREEFERYFKHVDSECTRCLYHMQLVKLRCIAFAPWLPFTVCSFLLSCKLDILFHIALLDSCIQWYAVVYPECFIPDWESLVWFILCTVQQCTMWWLRSMYNWSQYLSVHCSDVLVPVYVLVLWSWTYSLICIAIQFEPLIHFTYVLPSWLQRSCVNSAGVYVVSNLPCSHVTSVTKCILSCTVCWE